MFRKIREITNMKLKLRLSERRLERKLKKEAKSMSNEELREALWIARKHNMDNHEGEQEFTENNKSELVPIRESMIREGIYAEELKRRELLEWALKTGS